MPFQVEHLRMPDFMFKNYFGNVYTHTPTKPFMLMTCDLSILYGEPYELWPATHAHTNTYQQSTNHSNFELNDSL